MKFNLFSLFVNDVEQALKFYTEVLGFIKQVDMPAGENRFVTVSSPEGPDDIQLILEPNDNPISKAYQEGIFKSGLPATVFSVKDVQQEYERLTKLGVQFTSEPTDMQWAIIALFNDTCGNWIALHQY